MSFSVMGLIAAALMIALFHPLVGLLAFLSLIYLRIQDIAPELMGPFSLNMIGVVTLAGWLIQRQQSVSLPSQIFLLAGFLLASTLSLAHLSMDVIKAAIPDLLSKAFFVWLIINIVTTKHAAKAYIWCWLLLTTSLAVWITYQTSILDNSEYLYKDRTQYFGIFADPNDLALAYILMLPVAYYVISQARTLWVRGLAAFSFLSIAYATTTTLSRGAFVAVLAAVPVIFVRDRRRATAFILLVLLLGVLDPYIPSSFWARVESIEYNNPGQSAVQRIAAWEAGQQMFLDHPLLGVGKDQFLQHHVRAAHSAYFQVAAETGLFGLTFWVLLIAWTFKELYRVGSLARNHPEVADLELYAKGLEAGFVAFLVGAVFLSQAYSWLLFSFIGIAAALRQVADAAIMPQQSAADPKPTLAYPDRSPAVRSFLGGSS
ncbi:MAG: O-antigen ligase family protein [Nitrospirota bacterium]